MNEKLCTELVRARAISHDPSLVDDRYIPCECCGRWVDNPERHHRKFRSRGGQWTPANVILLCNACHVSATNETIAANMGGLNVQSWQDPKSVGVALWHQDFKVLLDDEGGYRAA